MAASLLGLLGHEACCYAAAPDYPPAPSSYCCAFPPELVAGSCGAVTMEQLPPAAAISDCFFLPEITGATDRYASPPAPVFATGGAAAENEMVNVSHVDDDGRRMAMSGSGGNNNGGGGGRPSPRIGFRTRSEVDVLDDGFKWRKYGKKAVKSSPNPRNYYRCSAEGCGVKKRVERDRDDPRYVVTTYDGVHNHAAPGSGSGGACLAPPRGAPQTQSTPPCSTSLVAAPWSGGPCDAWGMHTQLMRAATAAHSSESSY